MEVNGPFYQKSLTLDAGQFSVFVGAIRKEYSFDDARQLKYHSPHFNWFFHSFTSGKFVSTSANNSSRDFCILIVSDMAVITLA